MTARYLAAMLGMVGIALIAAGVVGGVLVPMYGIGAWIGCVVGGLSMWIFWVLLQWGEGDQ
jgi:hypothetical protein